MTDEQFCKIESEISGEHIDKVSQLQKIVFTGRELKNYCDQVIDQYWKMQKQNEPEFIEIYNKITVNGNREMTQERFVQAVKEIKVNNK